MTMPEQKKAVVPRLRFPEFRDAGPWEVKRLGEVAEVNAAGDLDFSQFSPVLTQEHIYPIYSNSIAQEGLYGFSTYPKYKKNSVTITARGTLGVAFYRDHDFVGIGRLLIVNARQEISPRYLKEVWNYLVREPFENGGIPQLTAIKARTIKLVFPSLPEQQKIADCLSSLDELIELQARQLEALKAHKKGLMQQLFPREGETTPRLRFPEFRDAGPWEVKRLGEVFCERSERGSNGLELLSVTISDGVVRAAELERKNNANADLSNYKKVCPGDIVYNSMRMWQGASGVSWWHGVVSPAYTVVTPKESQNAVFWAYCFKLEHSIAKFVRFSQGVTSDTWNLKYPAFSAIEMAFPAEQAEQQKIADCLSSLDELIELQARQLEALKAHKKGLMQQLFPQGIDL